MNSSVEKSPSPLLTQNIACPPAYRCATTVSGWGDERFTQMCRAIPFAEVLDQIPRRKFYPLAEFMLFFRVLVAAMREDVLLLFSSRGYVKPELLATALIGLWPAFLRPKIIFYGEMFEPDTGWRYQVERRLMRLVDRAVFRFALHSQAEISIFAQTWQIGQEKLRATGFFAKQTIAAQSVVRRVRSKHIFAGGTSFRDYEPLIAAARMLPDCSFVICTNRLDQQIEIPPNVQVGFVSPAEYDELLSTAAAVVVPLRKDVRRITGMLTYLQAMWAKQPVIVTDTVGTCEYITDGETGIVVDGSPQSYVEAIQRVLDPAQCDWVDKMCEQAHAAVCEQFTVARHVDQLLALIDEAHQTK